MTTIQAMQRRLEKLEEPVMTCPKILTAEERADAARRYEATLYEDDPVSPEAETYFATASLHRLTADYTAMLAGAPAPWE